MIEYKAEVNINVPAERVYRAISDAQKWPMWTSMSEPKVLSGTGFDTVGSQVESVMGGPMKEDGLRGPAEARCRLAFETSRRGSMQWDGNCA
jgi:uncharacterized protein YndB with AHSA1/START domain